MNRIFVGLLLLVTSAFLGGCSSTTPCYEECYIRPIAPSQPRHRIPQQPQLPSKPLAKITIDPGHGGKDAGALSLSKPVTNEKTLNLDAARLVQTNLRRKGFETTMTRKDDTFISLDGRASQANEEKADYFISVHFNSAPAPKAHGVEVFYYESKENPERSKASKALAQAVLDRIIETTGAKSRGVKHGNFAVIRKTKMPAILVEGGFMTHEEEMTKLRDPAYLQKIANGISQGIEEYQKKN